MPDISSTPVEIASILLPTSPTFWLNCIHIRKQSRYNYNINGNLLLLSAYYIMVIIPNALYKIISSFQEIYKELSRGHMAKRHWVVWDSGQYLVEKYYSSKQTPSFWISLLCSSKLFFFFLQKYLLSFDFCLVHVMIISHQTTEIATVRIFYSRSHLVHKSSYEESFILVI